MARIFKDYETLYKGRRVRTDSEEDMRYLYEEERLSGADISNVFDNKMSSKTVVRRLSKLGITRRGFKGEDNPMWAGGVKIDKGGYVLRHFPEHPQANSQGYVREHRLVMEESLGRSLTSEEVVHHINKDRGDNSIGNLKLLESNSAHAKLESNYRERDELGRFK